MFIQRPLTSVPSGGGGGGGSGDTNLSTALYDFDGQEGELTFKVIMPASYYNTVNREIFALKIFRGVNFRVK